MHSTRWCIACLLIAGLWAGPGRADVRLTWGDCARRAKAEHPDLRAAGQSVRAAEAAVGSSRATYLPDLDGSVDYTKPHSSSTGDNYSYGVSASQRLFPGLGDQPEVAQAKADLAGAEADYAATAASIRFDLRTAFANLLHAQKFMALTRIIEGRRRQNVDLIKGRFDAGRESKGSYLRAKAQAVEASYDVRQAERSARVAQQELLRAMGRRAFEDVRVDADFKTDSPPADPDFDDLAGRTPAVRKATFERRAAELGLTIEKRTFYPEITLSGSATRKDGKWPPKSTTGDWSSNLSLSVPLFSGGKERHDVDAARADIRRVEFDEQSARDFAVLDLRDQWDAYLSAEENVAVREEFLEAARVRAEIAQAQYASGLISYQDWDIIENDLIAQEKSMLSARRDAVLAEAAWMKTLGKGFEL